MTVLYLFASRYGRRWSVLPALPFLLNAVVPFTGDDAGLSGVLLLLVVVAALALGDSRRQRGEALAERDETRQAMVDTLQDQAAMGERARIARDLHDVVAHHVSAIAVQAESARLTTDGLPEEGKAHFAAIGQTARDALTEMRRLLGVLREDANAEATRDPQPSLDRLNELVETARAAGTPVTLTLEGAVTPLPTGVDLCAYRILQEALTNVRRHAPGAAVDVQLRYESDELLLRVRDYGPGAGVAGSATATACWACASARSWSGARSQRRRPTAAASWSRRRFRSGGDAMTIKVAVVDDQDIVRAGFAALLGTQEDFRVVGTAADGAEAVRLCREQTPDVVLMDVRMPVMDGIEATRRAPEERQAPPRVIVLTTFDLDEHVYDALGAGASGFLLKDVTADTLFDAVRVVAAGDALLAPVVTRRLVAEFARLRPPRRAARARSRELTPARDRGAAARRRGPVQRRDRRAARRQRRDGQDPCQPDSREARPARSHAGGRRGLRVGARNAPVTRARLELDRSAREALAGRLPAEPRVHGRADVGELALLVDPAGGVPSRRIREEQGVLARVVGRLRGRVTAVIRGDDEQVALPQGVEDVREPTVEVLEAAVEVHRVVAMAPEHVRLDEVHEHDPPVDVLEQLDRRG